MSLEEDEETRRVYHIAKAGESDSVKIARLEERMKTVESLGEQTLTVVRAMHCDIREHMKDEDKRVDALEQDHTKVKSDVRWMKLIGGSGISAALTWLGFK